MALQAAGTGPLFDPVHWDGSAGGKVLVTSGLCQFKTSAVDPTGTLFPRNFSSGREPVESESGNFPPAKEEAPCRKAIFVIIVPPQAVRA